MKEINECTKIEDETIDLRQGDIFVYDEDGIEAYGIIITGDCDITQNKCNGLITTCRLYSASYHIKNYILKEKCQKQLLNLEQKLKSQLHEAADFDINNDNFFSDIILLSPEELKTKIKSDYKKIEELKYNFSIYKKYTKEITFCMDDYKQIYLSMNKMSDENWQKQLDNIRNDIANSFKKLAGDLFYINKIPELDENGFVVHLRQISTFKKSLFFLDEQKNKEMFRIAHLNTPYIHSLTQRVGAMFSDIGLSEEYESNRQEILTELVRNI